MSVTNGERLVTKQDLADFYNDIRPYMGGLVTSKAGFTPIGTIISVMGTTAPVNYLACDGTVYNIADYTELANYFNEQFGSKNYFGGNGTTTFAVPDLRGEFLRGTGTNSHANQGSGANVGVHQDGTVIPLANSTASGNLCGVANGSVNNADTTTTALARDYVNKKASDNYGQTFTTRPTNTSVLYCIATKNFYIDPTLDYSTEEKIVGTWIDGRPIWQKTVSGTMPAVSSDTKISVSSDVVDFALTCKGVVPEYRTQPMSDYISVSNSTLMMTFFDTEEQKVYLRNNNVPAVQGKTAYVTVTYVKATS